MGEANFYYFTCLNFSLITRLLVTFAATVIAQTAIPSNDSQIRPCVHHYFDPIAYCYIS